MYTRRWLELLRSSGDPYSVQVRPDGRDEIFRGTTPVAFPQPGHFDYDLRIRTMDAAGIDVSIVSLTCPNRYWGGEQVTTAPARGPDRMDMGRYDLSGSVGFMLDTTLALTRMIFDGFLDRFPNLKLIASHGGGTLPYLVGRFEKGDAVELPQRRRMTAKPTEYLRRIWYDCITYDLGALRYLISVVGPERVLFGTDWPHHVHDVVGSLANTAALDAT